MDDLLREFPTETSESLDTVDNQLVRFGQEPNNAKIPDNCFRLVRTIKGTCSFLLVKYFKQTGDLWQINADVRAMVQHWQLNNDGRADRCPQALSGTVRSLSAKRYARDARKGARGRRRHAEGCCDGGTLTMAEL